MATAGAAIAGAPAVVAAAGTARGPPKPAVASAIHRAASATRGGVVMSLLPGSAFLLQRYRRRRRRPRPTRRLSAPNAFQASAPRPTSTAVPSTDAPAARHAPLPAATIPA